MADYFAMLRKSIAGETYSKTEHRRALRQLIPSRSEASLENKHRNISAVLMEEKLTWIPGYKPLTHYQGLLRDAVVETIDGSPWLVAAMEHTSAEFPELASMVDYFWEEFLGVGITSVSYSRLTMGRRLWSHV